LNRKVVSRLWLDDIWTIFTLEHIVCTVLDELMEAFYRDGNENLGLGRVGGGDVVGDAVEVGDDLVDGGRCCSAGEVT